MKKNIAVIFGGRSAEHDVSIITAHTPIISSLMAMEEYDVWPVYISKNGTWYCDKILNDFSFFKKDNFEAQLAILKPIQLALNNGLQLIWPGLFSKQINIDIAFPAMHGTYGEDGSVMGVLRMAGIPFVGCDLFASAVAMDKALTKQVLSAEGVPVVPYIWFTKTEWEAHKPAQLDKISHLKYPLFVKPVHLGSSIGITKVKQASELENALDVAFHYDDKILVEEGVENLIEVTLPIMGNAELQCANIERPLNKTELFDFNDKYLSGGKTNEGANSQYSELPANIDEAFSKQVIALGQKAYHTIGCEGIARIDFLIDEKQKKVYVNEVNTLPGSLYVHNWRTIKVTGVDLVGKLIALAQERFASQKDITYTFNSAILKQRGGNKIQ